MNDPGKLYIKTFGCQMNVYDTEKIYAFLQDSYVPAGSEEEADVIILNTCSIREKAEQKVYSLLGRIRHLKDIKPDLLIGVGGCVAQQEGERILRRSPVVDVVFGTHNLDDLPGLLEERRKNGKRIILTGWRISETGVFRDSCGGGIEYLSGIVRIVEKF